MDFEYTMAFIDENGNEVEYIFLDTIRYNKKDYDFFKDPTSDSIIVLEVGKETDDAVEYSDVDEKTAAILFKKLEEENNG